MNDYYRFRAEADEPTSAELMIFDAIGNWEDIGEVSCKAFARDLAALPTSVKRLDIHINSPGGSVYDAQGIYSRLADHRATKHVYIDGLAASAASIVAMVGHKIFIRANANMMIHLPSAITLGNEDEHDKTIRALRSITAGMINTYAKKTGLDRGEIRDMLAAETWFNAEEAVEKGFADEVRGVIKAAAMVDEKRVMVNGCTFDLSRFHNVPAFTAKNQTKGNKPMKPKAQTAAEEETPLNDPNLPADPPESPTPPSAPASPPQPTKAPDETIPKKPAKQFEDGVQAERARVAALQKLDRPATHAIVTKAIAEGKQPADIFEECMTAMDNANGQQARRSDASVLTQIPASDGTAAAEETEDFGVRLTKAVERQLKARGKRSALHSRN